MIRIKKGILAIKKDGEIILFGNYQEYETFANSGHDNEVQFYSLSPQVLLQQLVTGEEAKKQLWQIKQMLDKAVIV